MKLKKSSTREVANLGLILVSPLMASCERGRLPYRPDQFDQHLPAVIEGAVFGLLGLVLAIGGAASRLGARPDLPVEEDQRYQRRLSSHGPAPAPGDEPAVRALFGHYLDLRLRAYQVPQRARTG